MDNSLQDSGDKMDVDEINVDEESIKTIDAESESRDDSIGNPETAPAVPTDSTEDTNATPMDVPPVKESSRQNNSLPYTGTLSTSKSKSKHKVDPKPKNKGLEGPLKKDDGTPIPKLLMKIGVNICSALLQEQHPQALFSFVNLTKEVFPLTQPRPNFNNTPHTN
jgi:hypothetical protein